MRRLGLISLLVLADCAAHPPVESVWALPGHPEANMRHQKAECAFKVDSVPMQPAPLDDPFSAALINDRNKSARHTLFGECMQAAGWTEVSPFSG